MAESIYTIIDNGSFLVMHQGNEVELTLPAWLSELSGSMEDEELMLKWAKENEILHGLLHRGLKQLIIDLRASARPTIDTKTGNSKSIIDEKENAQERVNNYVVDITRRPGDNKAQRELNKLVESMKAVGIEQSIIDLAIQKYKETK